VGMTTRTPVSEKAKQFVKLLKKEENVDYNYLREVFRTIRKELNIKVNSSTPKKLPYVPTEDELSKYYEAVWKSRNMRNMVMMKTLLYTGVRVSELINIKISEIDLDECKIKVVKGKGSKDRIVPFPKSFKEILGLHIDNSLKKNAKYLFESNRRTKFTDRGVRKIMQKYTELAGIKNSISPHTLRHFLFTWLKKKGIDDALIQPYSGHDSRLSLEMYSKLSLSDCQDVYDSKIKDFPF
jgi:integrase/recombinase XerD